MSKEPMKCATCGREVLDGDLHQCDPIRIFVAPAPDRPNPTATAIAAWLRSVARDHRQAGEAKANLPAEADRVGMDSAVLRAFAQANVNSAQLLDVLAHQVEQRSWPTDGPAVHVHHLHHGGAACGRPGQPGDWPPGHKWSEEWGDVSCPACLEKRV